VAGILYRSVLDGFCTHVRFPAAGRRDRLAPSGRALAGALLPAVVLPDPFVYESNNACRNEWSTMVPTTPAHRVCNGQHLPAAAVARAAAPGCVKKRSCTDGWQEMTIQGALVL